MNKIEIEIPAGKEVDWEASAKQKQIVLKDKQLTYKDVCKELFKKEYFYFTSNGVILHTRNINVHMYDPNNATTKHQLECILAKNKLANVSRYLNGDWKPGKTNSGHFDAYVLFSTPDKDYIECVKIADCAYNSNVLFKSGELAQEAIKILGEEEIKLALEPLY